MEIIGLAVLADAKKCHADCRNPIDTWVTEAKNAQWTKYSAIKEKHRSADSPDGFNVIFNIKGNHYRLWFKINYRNKTIMVKKFGTHQEYMSWIIK